MNQFVTHPESADWMNEAQRTIEQLVASSLSDDLFQAFGQDVSEALGEALQAWQGQPEKFQEILDQWSKALGELRLPSGTDFSPANADRLTKTYSQLYQELVNCLNRLVDEAPDIDNRKRSLLKFIARQIISACAPENWPATNPKIFEKALSSKGGSLTAGLNLLNEDLAKSRIGLKVRTANSDDYIVGETIASTAGEVMYETPLFQLIQYYPASQRVREEPVLLVPPCINKYYVLDLTPATSMVQWLVRQGYTVFMISWINPDKESPAFSYRDYVKEGCIEAIEQVRKLTDEMPLHLLGYCISGTFTACAAAQLAKEGKQWLKSLTLMNTLLEYSSPGEVDVFVSERLGKAIQRFAEGDGLIEGEVLGQAFSFLREDRMIWPFVVNNYLLGKPPKPNPLLYWNQDTTNVSAVLLDEYLNSMYKENVLAADEPYEIADLSVDLAEINIPVFVLGSSGDHIVPWQGSYKSAQLIPSDVCFVLADGGHVSAVAHSPTTNHREYRYSAKSLSNIDSEYWYEQAEVTAGSWWGYWQEWMASLGELDQRRPRFPGDALIEPIEAAPGRYVKVSSCAGAQIRSNSAQ